jgi:hypothetical protein
MANASRFRALASLCRQQAAYDSLNSWHLLGEAERWEHLAEQELASHFNECNATSSGNLAQTSATRRVNDPRAQAIAAA